MIVPGRNGSTPRLVSSASYRNHAHRYISFLQRDYVTITMITHSFGVEDAREGPLYIAREQIWPVSLGLPHAYLVQLRCSCRARLAQSGRANSYTTFTLNQDYGYVHIGHNATSSQTAGEHQAVVCTGVPPHWSEYFLEFWDMGRSQDLHYWLA